MPTPKPGSETKNEFMDRCIPIVIKDGTAKNQPQAVAICSSMWDAAKKSKKSMEADVMKNDIERRTFAVKEIRVEAGTKAEEGSERADQPPKIIGHAAVFNSPTDMGWFEEVVAPGFFTNALKTSDVRMLFNHDPNYVLGRTAAGTLKVYEDGVGLFTENILPDTQFAKDLAISMSRGDINQMSFAWITKTDQWEKLDNGRFKRTLIEAEKVFDTSVVTYPAYEDTDATVAKRSHADWQEAEVAKAAAEAAKAEENRAAVSYSSHGDLPKIPEGTAWDAGAAKDRVAKWASSDGSGDKEKVNWGKYKEGFAWFDSAAPNDFGAYKLPHHDISGGQLEHHWRGIAAAMGALLGARGGVKIPSSDREAVYSHLRTEYGRYGKTAPDYRTVMDMSEEERIKLAELILEEPPDQSAIEAENLITGQARERDLFLTNFV